MAALRGEKVDVVPPFGEYIGLEQIESGTGRLSSAELPQQPEGAANVFEAGDVLFGKLRPYLAKGWSADRSGFCTTEALVLRPQAADPRFVRYCVLAFEFIEAVNGSTYGSKMPRADWSFVGSVQVPCPEPKSQERIANFLDEQTARIDALIAEKERLAERLGELRYSTVTWAVTGGLRAQRKTFSTGHAFVPALPVGWQWGGLTKYIGAVVDYRGKTPEKVENGVLLVTARNIRDGLLNYEASAEYVRPEAYAEIMRRGRPLVGDVLFTTEAPLGQVANIDRDDIALAQRIVKFRGIEGVLNNYFLKYWLMGDAVQATLATLATGSTAEGIKASKLGQIPLAVPPFSEQAEIVAYLDKRRDEFDSASRHVAEHTERLREYRSSLISAAVSGHLSI